MCRVKAHVARYERLVEVVVASRVAVAVRAKLLLAPHISTRSPSDEESIDISPGRRRARSSKLAAAACAGRIGRRITNKSV